MKNITLSVDDETYRLARIRAAEAGTSVSALVRAYLSDFLLRERAAMPNSSACAGCRTRPSPPSVRAGPDFAVATI